MHVCLYRRRQKPVRLKLWQNVHMCACVFLSQAAEAREAQVMAELRVLDGVTSERDQLEAQVRQRE